MKTSTKMIMIAGTLLFMGAGCSQVQQVNFDNTNEAPEQPPVEQPQDTMQELSSPTMPEGLPTSRLETQSDSKEGPVVVMKTTKGDITLQLFEEATPGTVKNFVELAKQDFYDGIRFHRVIPGFMAQSGDPNTKSDPDNRSIHGTGGPGYKFADEINLHSNAIGTISMANAGPNTNGSQFFINVADNSFLDGRHAVFGEVTEGLEVVTEIVNSETDPRDNPVVPVEILDIVVE